MRKFRFKFAVILKQRKAQEDHAMRALGVAQRSYHRELEQKKQMQRTLEDALVRREILGAEAVSIHAFQIEDHYIIGTKQRLIQQEQAIVRATRSVEKALRVFLNARKQTRMLETLYEKHYAEFKKEVSRKEQKELEDLTIMRARLNDDSDDTDMAAGREPAHHEGEVA